MNVLGIDPGKSGGLAVVSREINSLPRLFLQLKMPLFKLITKR